MRKLLLVLALIVGFSLFGVAQADQPDHKVTICHATSSATNPYVRIVVDEHATKGHFDEHGTPLAGHEEDILLQGEQDCPGPVTPPPCTIDCGPPPCTVDCNPPPVCTVDCPPASCTIDCDPVPPVEPPSPPVPPSGGGGGSSSSGSVIVPVLPLAPFVGLQMPPQEPQIAAAEITIPQTLPRTGQDPITLLLSLGAGPALFLLKKLIW